MAIMLFIGKLANSCESVDLGDTFNSGDCGKSEDCCESRDFEKYMLFMMRLMILFTL